MIYWLSHPDELWREYSKRIDKYSRRKRMKKKK